MAPAGSVPGCRRTQVLFPASVLLRRADAVAVIGAALLAKAGGAGTGGSPCWWAAVLVGCRPRRCGFGDAGSLRVADLMLAGHHRAG